MTVLRALSAVGEKWLILGGGGARDGLWSRRTPENCTSYQGFGGFLPAAWAARRGNISPRRELAKLLIWISLRRPFTLTQYVCGRLGDAFNIRPARSPSLVRKTTPLAA